MLIKGSVTVDSGGTASGDGLALVIYTALIATYEPLPSGAGALAARRQVADLCNAVATVADYITANAEVAVTVSAGGLQRVGGLDTDAPAAPRVLSGAIT